MIVSQILTAVGIMFVLLKSIDFIYLFQTKEYRFDRIRVLFSDENIFYVFFGRSPRLPAKSARNFLIFFQTAVILLLLGLILIALPIIYAFVFLIFSPVIAFLLTSSSVITTGFFARLKRNSLIKLAQEKLINSKTIFIGITGSYGKSTTKEFLYLILSGKFKVAKTEQNMNSDVGVAISIIKNLSKDTEIFITEMGAYKKGEIKSICNLVHPTFGIVTALGNQHLELFGSKKNLVAAKQELLLALPTFGKAYVNSDTPEYGQMIKTIKSKISSFSLIKKADIVAKDIKSKDGYLMAKIVYKKTDFPIKTKLFGFHNIMNILPCVGLAYDLGISKFKIIEAVNNLQPFNKRLSFDKGINDATIIDDSYNSNVEGFIAAINLAAQFRKKTKFLISRGIIELGKEKNSSYKRILKKLDKSDLRLLTTDKLFANLDKTHVKFFLNEKDLFNFVKDSANKNTLLIIEGKFPAGFINNL